MKKVVFIFLLSLVGFTAGAWNGDEDIAAVADTSQAAVPDTLYCNMEVIVDTLLAGMDVFGTMPSRLRGDAGTVTIIQSREIRDAMKERVTSSSVSGGQGYRIRIFFSNDQNAREASMAVAHLFGGRYPGHNIYRTFVNPNFKVTVGDFRTRSEALKLLDAMKYDFPGAFIVRENIHYSY